MAEPSAERQVAQFMVKYSADIARAAKTARAKVRKLLPGAVELVYDNYGALALAFSSTEKASDIILSVTLYPKWVSLFFARGASLPDPKQVLRGSGTRIRHAVLKPVSLIDAPAVRSLIKAAIDTHPTQVPRSSGRTIIKSVSSKQRPRRSARVRGRPTRG